MRISHKICLGCTILKDVQPQYTYIFREASPVLKSYCLSFTAGRYSAFSVRGAFGKFLAWSFISVTNSQTLSCFGIILKSYFPFCYITNSMRIL